ncbi:dipeptide epimerase [Christiangramia salexigens]|uniref:Dipeptide epimerase n=1 Tax=Christiangramia salexigens TaxID=1913577 RepID=A0A1L3J8L3_9FLAO|nr:dipeptide epimerase [Christiangramia salexigens]APG61458.1 dipeptide epimerase [Christiangramia salexigens]
MKIDYRSFNLELRETFTVSYGSRNFQPTLIVCLSDGEFTGYGEAAATSYYGVSVDKMQYSLQQIEEIIRENIQKYPEELWETTFPYLKDNLFAQAALDIAMHDLHAKRNGLPLYKQWGLELKNLPKSNYTIGIDSVERMVQKMKAFPWPLYKIKLGTKEDVRIIQELRKHTDSVFRVDANASWGLDDALYNIEELKDLNVEFIEQPLNPKDTEAMKILYKESALPLIADESCILEQDIENCAEYFHGVNIKLSKCGGLTPALRMIKKARDLGLKTMVGCMTESSVGISAIAHLTPMLDYVDMDGALLLKSDIADGIKVFADKIYFPERNGTGAILLN